MIITKEKNYSRYMKYKKKQKPPEKKLFTHKGTQQGGNKGRAEPQS